MLTIEDFLRDVADHKLHVLHDDGVYRHILMRGVDSCYSYSLLTFPGHLAMVGDMGAWTFQRLHDMFEFFRTGINKDGTLRPNHGYWAEKLVAVDGNRHKAGCMEFDPDEFRDVVRRYRRNLVRQREGGDGGWTRCADGITRYVVDTLGAPVLDKDQRRELWEAIDEEVLDKADEGEDRAMTAAHDFSWGPDSARRGEFYFSDFSEHNCQRYTHAFQWSAFAIPWAISKYDAHKEATKPSPPPAPELNLDECPF